jgi:hypothetical protein
MMRERAATSLPLSAAEWRLPGLRKRELIFWLNVSHMRGAERCAASCPRILRCAASTAAAALLLFPFACGDLAHSEESATTDPAPKWGESHVDPAIVAAALACEPELTCGERDLALVERRNSQGQTYVLTVQHGTTFRRFDGRDVRVLSRAEVERIENAVEPKFVLTLSLEWMDASSVQVMTRGRLLRKKEPAASTLSGSMGRGIACGNFDYYIQKRAGVWSCRDPRRRVR